MHQGGAQRFTGQARNAPVSDREALERVANVIGARAFEDAVLRIARKLAKDKRISAAAIIDRFNAEDLTRSIQRILQGETDKPYKRITIGMIVVYLHEVYTGGVLGETLDSCKVELAKLLSDTVGIVAEQFPSFRPARSRSQVMEDARNLAASYLAERPFRQSDLPRSYAGNYVWVGRTMDPEFYRLTLGRLVPPPTAATAAGSTTTQAARPAAPSFICAHGSAVFRGVVTPKDPVSVCLEGILRSRKVSTADLQAQSPFVHLFRATLHGFDHPYSSYGTLMAPDPAGTNQDVTRLIKSVRIPDMTMFNWKRCALKMTERLKFGECIELLTWLTCGSPRQSQTSLADILAEVAEGPLPLLSRKPN